MHHPEIERALRFVADNLDQPLTLADVARAAHLSEFHFHRLFHAALGEPLGRFITRRRLEVAALRLAYERDRSITDVALSSGYSSTSNFSKAFSAFFGCSPSQVRHPTELVPPSIGRLTSQYGKDFRATDLYTLSPEVDASERRRRAAELDRNVRYEMTEGIDFACLASPGGYDANVLAQTWDELIRRGQQLGFCGDPIDAWGIAHDSPQVTAPELCRYHACVPCPPEQPLPPPLFRGRLQPGRYAVFLYDGAVTGISDAFRDIYSCWFAESALQPEDFTPFERYISDAPKDGHVRLENWIKVRPRQ